MRLLKLFSNRKRDLINFNFFYSYMYCHIEGSTNKISDDWLVLSYLTYLTRYFYICDERQIAPMKDFLKSFIYGEVHYKEYPYLHEAVNVEIFKTLTDDEKNAVLGIFWGITPMPPLYLTEDISCLRKPVFKYSLEIFNSGNDISHKFHMPKSPDIILLPLTVTLFFEYVQGQFMDENSTTKMLTAILELLDYYKSNDCRNFQSLVAAAKILNFK